MQATTEDGQEKTTNIDSTTPQLHNKDATWIRSSPSKQPVGEADPMKQQPEKMYQLWPVRSKRIKQGNGVVTDVAVFWPTAFPAVTDFQSGTPPEAPFATGCGDHC